MELLRLEHITKNFGKGDGKVAALRDISLKIDEGELVAIIGKSGSGKSTLLNVIGSLMRSDGGEYYYKNNKMDFSKERVATEFRKNKIGFIVQYFGLIDDKNVYQNVALPLKYQKRKKSEIRKKVTETLRYFEIESKIKAYPNQLSGGQKQRVAIARAVVKESEIILADEPTGALDYNTSKDILELIERVNQKYGNTVIMVTHNDAIKDMADIVIRLRDGAVRKSYRNEKKIPARELDW